jgi:GT2 family glycosyltransferase
MDDMLMEQSGVGVVEPQRETFTGRMISVIIPTKYRPDDIEATVQSVLRQTIRPGQIVVIDQSATQEIRLRLEKLFDALPEKARAETALCHIYDPAIVGAAAARNRGMDAATGSILLFLDDDVNLEELFIEKLLEAYQRNPATAGVSGVFTNYRRPGRLLSIWRVIFQRGPFWDERQEIYWNADRLRDAAPIPVKRFTGALMSFRASKVKHLRFDENVRGTSAEDADFCARISIGKGEDLLVTPGARLFHKLSSGGRSRKHWVYTEMERAYYLYLRNWDSGFYNRLCMWWLVVGYSLIGMFASLRQGSLEPLRSIGDGMQVGKEEAMAGRPR